MLVIIVYLITVSYPGVVLVRRKEPDLELEGLLKRHSTTVKFFQGSMMNAMDLARVKVVALDDMPAPDYKYINKYIFHIPGFFFCFLQSISLTN